MHSGEVRYGHKREKTKGYCVFTIISTSHLLVVFFYWSISCRMRRPNGLGPPLHHAQYLRTRGLHCAVSGTATDCMSQYRTVVLYRAVATQFHQSFKEKRYNSINNKPGAPSTASTVAINKPPWFHTCSKVHLLVKSCHLRKTAVQAVRHDPTATRQNNTQTKHNTAPDYLALATRQPNIT